MSRDLKLYKTKQKLRYPCGLCGIREAVQPPLSGEEVAGCYMRLEIKGAGSRAVTKALIDVAFITS